MKNFIFMHHYCRKKKIPCKYCENNATATRFSHCPDKFYNSGRQTEYNPELKLRLHKKNGNKKSAHDGADHRSNRFRSPLTGSGRQNRYLDGVENSCGFTFSRTVWQIA